MNLTRSLTNFPEDVQNEILAHTRLLEEFGPQLGRPRVDTLNGSSHANMKDCASKPLMVSGAWPSRSIFVGVQSCLSPGINRASAKNVSIVS